MNVQEIPEIANKLWERLEKELQYFAMSFLQKYAKTNPQEVLRLVNNNSLSNLSQREATRLLNKKIAHLFLRM